MTNDKLFPCAIAVSSEIRSKAAALTNPGSDVPFKFGEEERKPLLPKPSQATSVFSAQANWPARSRAVRQNVMSGWQRERPCDSPFLTL